MQHFQYTIRILPSQTVELAAPDVEGVIHVALDDLPVELLRGLDWVDEMLERPKAH